MKTHTMKLQTKYFEYIKEEKKKIEIRLNDEKRKNIKVGDYIEFKKLPFLKETLKTKVTNIYVFNSFNNLIDNFDIEILAGEKVSKKEFINILNNIYSKEEQKLNGAIAIEIEIIK